VSNLSANDFGEWTARMPYRPLPVRHGFTIGTAAQKLFESWLTVRKPTPFPAGASIISRQRCKPD